MDNTHDAVFNFWNDRAVLKERAGTNDLIAKQLEIEAIAKYVRDGMSILEVGCGNGITAFELANRFDVDITAIDYAKAMIAEARALFPDKPKRGKVSFEVASIDDLKKINKKFDMVYTERVLINLPDWSVQQRAITDICDMLRPGGYYIMCENSQTGLSALNRLRAFHDLPEIVAPWHNRYLIDDEVEELNEQMRSVYLDSVDEYSSTYYFLSRIVNAAVSAQEGRMPAYDSPINKLALRIPAMGKVGQGKIWKWIRQY